MRGFFFVVLFLAAVFVALLLIVSSNLPSVEQLDTQPLGQSTKIYDREHKVLLYEISAGQRRTVVPLERIPQALKDATVVVEDEKFYGEPAFDWRAILRALAANLLRARIVQGGSTITQQLAKNAFLSPEKTLTRKLREFLLAIQINRKYTKDQILGFYLNEIPYGPTLLGVEAASETYFGKPVSDVTVAEAALLAALPRAPSYYSPWGNHVKELLARQRFILDKLYRLNKISKDQYDGAVAFRLVFQPQGRGIKAPHFVMAVQDYLVKKYGEDLVRSGGLAVTTTLDWKFQEAAEKAVREGAAKNEELYKGDNAAAVVEDPATGQILALVGSRDYFDVQREGNFNVATQGLRQPGSALKPFIYLAAFARGFVPETILFDVPTEFVPNNPACPPIPDYASGKPSCFHPQDFDRRFRGPIPIRAALAQSVNIPAVKMLYLVGMNNALRTLGDFGITTLTDPARYGLSLVLGGGEVRLSELVGAYATLASEGVRHEQALVLSISDHEGKILESYGDKAQTVMDAQYVRAINNILSDTGERSGLFGNSLSLTTFPDHDVALKTGTTNDYRDAWALGYTPSVVVGVWAGNNDNAPMQRRGSSILAAVPIWHALMERILDKEPGEAFSRPSLPVPTKPALAGNYIINNEVHTILYWVKKDDPVGPPPEGGVTDPQFLNWELGVRSWAEKNIPALSVLAASSTATTSTSSFAANPPEIIMERPAAGEFVGTAIRIDARITSLSPIEDVTIFFNGSLVRENRGSFGLSYALSETISPQNISSQNLIEVEVKNRGGRPARSSVIVYAQ